MLMARSWLRLLDMSVAQQIKEKQEKQAPDQDEQNDGRVAKQEARGGAQVAGRMGRAKAQEEERAQQDGLDAAGFIRLRLEHPQEFPLTQAVHHQDHQDKKGESSLEQHQDQERQEDQGRQPALGVHRVLLSLSLWG